MPVITESELRKILKAPAESVSLDFKRQVDWSRTGAKIDVAKDVACMANRSGGLLVYGVEQTSGGIFNAAGLAAGDDLPDATVIAQAIGRWLDPVPTIEAATVVVDGKRFGVIQVREFRRLPHVSKAVANDERGVERMRPGEVYRRGDDLSCGPVATAVGMGELVEAAAAKSGALTAALLPRTDPDSRRTPAADDLLGPDSTVRACDVLLASPAASLRVAVAAVQASVVRDRYGSTFIPRYLDFNSLEPSQWVREPGRVLVELRRGESASPQSVIEVTPDRLRLREVLWEADGVVNFTGLVTFTLCSILFARSVAVALGHSAFTVRVGLVRARGRVLADDPGRFGFFWQTYTATAAGDLWAERELTTGGTESPGERAAAARSIVDELVWYFGWTNLTDQAWDQHLAYIRELLPQV